MSAEDDSGQGHSLPAPVPRRLPAEKPQGQEHLSHVQAGPLVLTAVVGATFCFVVCISGGKPGMSGDRGILTRTVGGGTNIVGAGQCPNAII